MAGYTDPELIKRINRDFTYHAPMPEAVEDMVFIRQLAREFAHYINDVVPNGREKSTALARLEEVVMHANSGIVRNQ